MNSRRVLYCRLLLTTPCIHVLFVPVALISVEISRRIYFPKRLHFTRPDLASPLGTLSVAGEMPRSLVSCNVPVPARIRRQVQHGISEVATLDRILTQVR